MLSQLEPQIPDNTRHFEDLKLINKLLKDPKVQLIKIDKFVDFFDFNLILKKAIYFNNLSTVKYLYDEYPQKISSISEPNPPQDYILSEACSTNAIEVARWIIEEKGAEVNNTFYINLINAVSHKDGYELVEYLLSKGADVNQNSNFLLGILLEMPLSTPLHKAIERKDIKTAKLLLENGADTNKCDIWGKMAIHKAAENSDLPMMDLLVKYRANPNEKVELKFEGFTKNDGKTATQILYETSGITEVLYSVRLLVSKERGAR